MRKNIGSHDSFYPPTSSVRTENGDLVRCIKDNLKYLDKGRIYIAENVMASERKNRWNSSIKDYNCYKIRVKGTKTHLSSRNFELVDEATIREIGVDQLLGNDIVLKEEVSERKFDRISDKEKFFELTIKIMKEMYLQGKYYKNTNMELSSDYDGLVDKLVNNDSKFGLKKSDFDNLSDMSVSDFFNTYINNIVYKKENKL